jgi:putative transposase
MYPFLLWGKSVYPRAEASGFYCFPQTPNLLITERLRTTAENYGMKIEFVEESYISSVYTRCGSTNVFKNKRLFKCLNCKPEAHRDAVGCVNMGLACSGIQNPAEAINRATAYPCF